MEFDFCLLENESVLVDIAHDLRHRMLTQVAEDGVAVLIGLEGVVTILGRSNEAELISNGFGVLPAVPDKTPPNWGPGPANTPGEGVVAAEVPL